MKFLFEFSPPRFGQWVTWILLVFALCLAAIPFEPQSGIRSDETATIIGFLPQELISAAWFYEVIRWVLVVSALAWMVRRGIPWACWLTCISFTMLWALRMENTSSGAHIFNLTNMLLIIQAMWFHFYSDSIKASLNEYRFWETPLYPRWVFLLSVFYIGLFHTLAGLSKLSHSGFDWGNGLSLQLWIHLFGWPGSPFGNLILSNRTLAGIFQSSALVFETISILCIFSKWLRLFVGLSLLGFYLGVLTTFINFGFHFNAIIVAMFLLPFEPWLNGRWTWRKKSVDQVDAS